MRILIAGFIAVLVPTALPAADRPNVLLIVADDLGWADLGCYGNRFHETPHLDRLAAGGLRFTDAYAAGPVCSPTRAALQTGQYQARFGLTAHIPGHWRPFERLAEPPPALQLPDDTVTVAEALRAAGYATGYLGKWHLGGKGSTPERHGFTTVVNLDGAGAHVVPPARQVPPGPAPVRKAAYLGDKAVEFVEQNKDRPFFLQICHFAVHIPIDTTPELLRKYEAKPKVAGHPCHPGYAGLLEEMDTSVGRVLAALDRLQLAGRTVVVFTSDNGGLVRESGGWPGTSNAPLRDEKGSLYEGGIRVPLLVRWPGVTPEGGVSSEPVCSVDLCPTVLETAGVRADPDHAPDGVSLGPVLRKPAEALKREALYWHYPHYHHSRPSGAIRVGAWKAVEFFDTGAVELFNLADDLGESKDLAAANPDKARALRQLLRRWRATVNAQMPQPNPAYDPARAGEWWSRAKVVPTEAPGTYRPGAARKK